MRASAPASSANLGPGFDALALALSLRVEVTVEPASSFSITSEGEGSEHPRGPEHLAAQVACEVAGTDRIAIHVRSDVPVARGLGSSASLAVAAAAAAGATDPLKWGFAIDRHPENAAASVLGGLVAATVVEGEAVAYRLPIDPGIVPVLLVPDRTLSTAEARAALPAQVPLTDAAFTAGRTAVLIAALADRTRLRPELMEDRLHQAVRAARLYPEAPPVLAGLLAAGASGACWSGAGPSLLALCDGDDVARRVAAAGERLLDEHHLGGRALVLTVDRVGLVVDGEPCRGHDPARSAPTG